MRDIRKVYNKVVGQEEECAVRDRRMAAREAEVTQRGKDVEKMVKDARSDERRAKKAAAGATKVVKDEDAPWETSALAATAADKPRPYAARNLPPKKPPTPEPDRSGRRPSSRRRRTSTPRSTRRRPSSRDRRDARRQLGAERPRAKACAGGRRASAPLVRQRATKLLLVVSAGTPDGAPIERPFLILIRKEKITHKNDGSMWARGMIGTEAW